MSHVERKLFIIMTSLLLVLSMVLPGMVTQAAGKKGAKVQFQSTAEQKVEQAVWDAFAADEVVDVLVMFQQRADTKAAVKQNKQAAKQEGMSAYKQLQQQRSAVVTTLKNTAWSSQQDVKEYLAEQKKQGQVKAVNDYYIVNAISATVTEEVATELAAYPEVEAIQLNQSHQLPKLEEKTLEESVAEWNIDRIKAPAAWEKEAKGDGAVVALIDTGIEWAHAALKTKYRGYQAETDTVDHTFSWFDTSGESAEPVDDNGSGTMMTGLVVGGDADNQIGVAPDAKFIGVKAFHDGATTDADLLAAAEWVLAPVDAEGNTRVDMAPDIVVNAWSMGPGENEWFRQAVQEWRHAGILPIFPTGNRSSSNKGGEGSVEAPANYPESFAVGATDIGDVLSTISLLGPSPYDEIKPNMVAPGQAVKSSYVGGGYAVGNSTGLAAAQVGGAAAILRAENPMISVDELEALLQETAKPLTDEAYPTTPNHGYGYGLLDVHHALQAIDQGIGTVEGNVTKKQDGSALQATVSLLGTERLAYTSATDGAYALTYAGGDYTLVAESYGYQAIERDITLGETAVTENFELQALQQAELSGTIVDATTGTPVEHALIQLKEDANVKPVRTDGKGTFNLTGYEGTYTLQIAAKDYEMTEKQVEISQAGESISVELEPFFSYPGEELIYDDGTGEGGSWFHDAGNAWSVKMSLAEGKDRATLTGGKFLFSKFNADVGGDHFHIEVLAADGPNGAPGTKIAGPIDAEARKDGEWTFIDLEDQGIVVDGDFYLVYIQTKDSREAPKLQNDKSGTFTKRSWEMYRGHWYQLEKDFLTGNKMIRAIVDYEVDTPVITSPDEGHSTIERLITVEGSASPTTMIELKQNGKKIDTVEVGESGSFAIDAQLEVGENKFVAISLVNGREAGTSHPVTITREEPTIKYLKPAVDQYVQPGDEVRIAFLGNDPHAKAYYTIKLPTKGAQKYAERVEMIEKLPGSFEAIWQVPQDVSFTDAVIEVELVTEDGYSVTEQAPGKLHVAKETINRIAGDIRYDTAIEISKTGWAKADTVILARGDEFADSLAGVPLGHALDAPILLTPSDKLWNTTKDEIKRLQAKQVVILGGEKAISNQIEADLKKQGLSVKRIAGDTRFETAAYIADELAPNGTKQAVVANGMDFPDALSVAAHAAKEGLPILLTRPDVLPKGTEAAIKKLGLKETIVVGGPQAVHDKIANQLPSVKRLHGHDRYGTNIAIAKHFGVENKHQYVATGKEYADALTGAVLAAKQNSGIILVHHRVPKDTAPYIQEEQVKFLSVFGGEVAVSKEVFAALKELLQ